MIVHSEEIVTLLGASNVSDDVFAESLRLAPCLVAADGGAAVALAQKVMPDAVIGDLDSLTSEARAQIPAHRLHRIAEQDSTDFDKALRHIAAPLVLAIGFTGQRLDHELAVYNALVRNAGRRAIVVGEYDICFHIPASIRFSLPVGTRVSLFPFAEVRGTSTGLRWPIDGLAFSPSGRVGTSNEASEDLVEINPSGPGLLAILPRTHLGAAIRALAG